jgi:hypothetical protein
MLPPPWDLCKKWKTLMYSLHRLRIGHGIGHRMRYAIYLTKINYGNVPQTVAVVLSQEKKQRELKTMPLWPSTKRKCNGEKPVWDDLS